MIIKIKKDRRDNDLETIGIPALVVRSEILKIERSRMPEALSAYVVNLINR